MNYKSRFFFLTICIGLLSFSGQIFAQSEKQKVQASLLADTSVIVPGKPFRVGLYLQIQPGWHIYWKNPGDSGLPPDIQWKLPPGFQAASFQWPIPRRSILKGDIIDYVYTDHILLITEILPPPFIDAKEVVLQGHATWLVCEDICVPEEAEVSLVLPVGTSAGPANTELFSQVEEQLPATTVPFSMAFSESVGEREIRVQTGSDIKNLSFYPLPSKNQNVGKIVETYLPEQKIWKIEVPSAGNLEGILVAESEQGIRKGYALKLTKEGSPLPLTPSVEQSSNGTQPSLSLLKAIFYAFIGGFILNLMPCVFPVISLKIFSFVQQAGEKRAVIFRHGLAFAGGVFTWFFALAAIVVWLQRQGQSPHWAFQFQNPVFNFIIISVIFVFALNLLGVFEIFLPGAATTKLSELTEKRGLWGSFFQGCFATLLATPCTAPFLGVALGFAFSQSGATVFYIFAAVAFGLALPYLLLSAQTGWMRFVPRPGAWMDHMKQFMAFPLLATVVWLLMVLGSQRGLSAVVATLSFLLCLAFCCWMLGTFAQRTGGKWHRFFLLGALAISFCAASFLWPEITGTKKNSGIPWKPYSEAAVQETLAAGNSVFIDFTADWCLSCKFNEKTAIERPAVIAAFRSQGVVPFKADWTNQDPAISETLRNFGRAGVPFYLFYPAGKKQAPIILPELLTEAILLEALKKK